MESSKTKKSSWKEITDAFHTLKTREEKKTLQNRLLEEVQAFPFAIKGSLQGTFKSLESGTLFQQKALREIYRYTFHPQQAFQKDQAKQRQIQRNCEKFKVPYPFGPEHISLKHEFGKWTNTMPMGMAGALNKLGLPLLGTHHRGLDDARNISNIAIEMIQRGWRNPLL